MQHLIVANRAMRGTAPQLIERAGLAALARARRPTAGVQMSQSVALIAGVVQAVIVPMAVTVQNCGREISAAFADELRAVMHVDPGAAWFHRRTLGASSISRRA